MNNGAQFHSHCEVDILSMVVPLCHAVVDEHSQCIHSCCPYLQVIQCHFIVEEMLAKNLSDLETISP